MEVLNIYTYSQTLTIELTSDLLEGSLQQLKKYVSSLIGYSSQIYLYREPLSTFFRLDFVSRNASVHQILAEFGSICLTYNNRQHVEEPDFYHEFPKSANDLMVVAQTCHENRFSYDRYKIDSKMPVSFLKNIAMRSSMESNILYYQLRVALTQFANEEAVSNTIARIAYPNKTVILAADQRIDHRLLHEINDTSIVDFEEFYVIQVENRKLVMSREAEWKIVAYLISIIFKTAFIVENEGGPQKDTFVVEKNVNLVRLLKQVNVIQLLPPLSRSFFLGKAQSYLIFLQQSSVLHVYQSFHPFQSVNSVVLCCQPSIYLQEQIPILHAGQLIMYSVTRSCMILKYYSLPLGLFQYARHFQWQKEYGVVQAETLDLISARYRGNLIRVFYVYAPHECIEIRQPEHEWFIFVSKLGLNVLSDGSGIFAVGGKSTPALSIFNLHTKQKIAAITLSISPVTIQSVSFGHRTRKVLICSEEYCFEHEIQGTVADAFKKDHKGMVYGYSPQGNIFQASPTTFKWQKSSQLRVKQGVLIMENEVLAFNEGLQAGNFNNILQLKKK